MVDFRDPSTQSRIIYLAVFSILIFSANVVVAIPVPVSSYTQQFYDYINKYESTDLFYIGAQALSSGTVADMYETIVSFTMHMKQRHQSMVWVSISPEAHVLYAKVLEEVYGPDYPNSPEYGIEFVDIGYLAGAGEFVFATHAFDIRGVSDVDRFGNRLDDLPLIQDVNSVIEDFSLVVGLDLRIIHQLWVVPYGIDFIQICVTEGPILHGATIAAGLIKGMLSGIRGGAEYELLSGVVGRCGAYTFAQTALVVFTLLGLTVANVYYVGIKREVAR